MALGNFPIELLQKELNLRTNQLSATLLHQVDDNFYRFNQLIIPTSSINFSKPTFCPQCFSEESNQPIHHLLLAVTHCQKHQCVLIDFNVRNEKRLTWSTPGLPTIMEDASSTVRKEIIPTVTCNINQLLLSPSERLLIDKQQFDLKNYLVLLHFFAHYHQRSFSNQTKRALQLPNEQRAKLYNTASNYLNDWPTGFYKLLNRFIINPMAQRGETGIRHYFRDLYDEIYSGAQQEIFAYQFLMGAFESYLENEFSESAFTNSLTRIKMIFPQICRHLIFRN
ncbi:TniQ family protein [Psychromonas sp. GE-S-Ul-11]|uniref:TniQ family protein n=1 Tax=Psychromonas sp. GE-S-Ul-11 TaxID=3241170 RepID=UPI003AADFFD4